MLTACPTSDVLSAFLDGELSQNEASVVERHLCGCERCRVSTTKRRAAIDALRSSEPRPVGSELRASVLARIEATPRRSFAWLMALPAAAAALWLIAVPDEFTARGGASTDVGCRIFGGDRELSDGATVARETRFSVDAFRGAKGERSFMAFAIDSGGDVHWLYPAYTDASTDPASLALSHEGFLRLPDAIALSEPHTGSLRLVCLFSAGPLRVSDVEAAAGRGAVSSLGRTQTLSLTLTP